MYVATARSLDLGRLEDAGFLYYAAQLRARFDLKRFPPVDKGGDSPGVALAAVSHQVALRSRARRTWSGSSWPRACRWTPPTTSATTRS
jgi:hypothetical protein